ncbi:MAG: SH3 domain-containing protein [Gallionella sp.]|jgi:hypothetical protein|nr:SH3 domain-containing protein [Gallionella sp.]
MKRIFVVWLLLSWLPCTVYAEQQTSYTVRATEIKQQPYSDAATVGMLAEKASVKVVLRQGGWVKVSSGQGDGWVKMLNLRSSSTKQGDSGLQSLFNLGRSGSSGITVATGVRGLSEEDLKNAKPNFEEFAKMKNYAANKNQAEKFARNGKLNAQTLDFIPASGN